MAYYSTGCDISSSILLNLLAAISSVGSIKLVTNVAWLEISITR